MTNNTSGEPADQPRWDPRDLKPHQKNDEIYGDRKDLDAAFISDIRTNGIVKPVVIDPTVEPNDDKATIIDGHRRVEAAKEINLETVPVNISVFDSELERLNHLIIHNQYREKTFSQKMREAEELRKIERKRAKGRQGTRTDLVENLPQGEMPTDGETDEYGKTRDKVAELVNIGCGRTVGKAFKVWEKATEGDGRAQQEVKRLDRGMGSIERAYQAVSNRSSDGDTTEDVANGGAENRHDRDNSDQGEADETIHSDDLVLSAHVGTSDEVFPKVLDLHVNDGAVIADVTYGNGTFWKQVDLENYELWATDIDPEKSPDSDRSIDCRDLPYGAGEIDCVVLDPPFAEGFYSPDRADDRSDHWINNRYGAAGDGEETYHEGVLQMYFDAGREAGRVLQDDGTLIVKVQDEVSRNEQRLTHIELTTYYAEELGFKAEDLFVLVRQDTPISSNIKNQRRARKNHSYFMVFID